MDLPIAVLMLGIVATLLLPSSEGEEDSTLGTRRWEKYGLYVLAAFVFGTIACVNTWDMPVYALILATVLLVRTFSTEKAGRETRTLASTRFCAAHLCLAFWAGLSLLLAVLQFLRATLCQWPWRRHAGNYAQ